MLAAATSHATLQPILVAFGFAPRLEPLDVATRAALGIPTTCRDVCIGGGTGALRALVLTTHDHVTLRDSVRRIAARLAATAPHILWMLVVTDSEHRELAFAAWPGGKTSGRITALLVERERILDSDAETACALAAAHSESDALTHARWLDILGREAVTRRFYRALERLTSSLADSLPHRIPPDDRSELGLLCTSRLLFLSFLEAKGWLDGDRGFLARTFDECAATGGHYHRRVLLPLLHGTLNTRRSARSPAARAFGRIPFLNGGLFARTPVERRHRTALFTDERLGPLFSELLTRYRFTAREDSATWSEAAIDPEMLGKAFESIMAARERKHSGAYFTPQPLVDRVTSAAIAHALGDMGFPDEPLQQDGANGVVPATRPTVAARPEKAARSPDTALRTRLARIRILDPACGSGAFLVHALERVADLHARLGDQRDIVEIRRTVLTRTIFGVDRNPFAVWLCELRLWLSMVIESTTADPDAIPPLPNLDHHIRVGDALSGDGLAPLVTPDGRAGRSPTSGNVIARLRERYVRATGPRKRTLARELDRAERARATALIDAALASNAAQRCDILAALRSRDLFGARRSAAGTDRRTLDTLRIRARDLRRARRTVAAGVLPFAFPTHFADAATAGGFDVVIGNPPWVRLHRIPPETRAILRTRFQVFLGDSWHRGASIAHAGAGFASQVDLAALFVERSLELLRTGGTFSLLLPSKLWHSLAGGSLRRLLHQHARVLELEDLGESPHAFDAAVYPSILVASRRGPPIGTGSAHASARATSDSIANVEAIVATETAATPARAETTGIAAEIAATASDRILATTTRASGPLRWNIPPHLLPFDDDPASPWLVLPREVRHAFDLFTDAGIPLGESTLGRPRLGVKCGCNAAFLVTVVHDPLSAADLGFDAPDWVEVEAPGRRGRIERACLRPLLRGESLQPWRVTRESRDERILWLHDATGAPVRTLPPLARHWLTPWRRRLLGRSDAAGHGPWWMLFRTDSARHDLPRVVWPDLGRAPRAVVLPAGDETVALNSCYVVRCPTLDDAHALAVLLNGPLAAAWLNAIAEPARGNFHRYLGWTTALLPIPRDWPRARTILAPIGARACDGTGVATPDLLDAALAAYRLEEIDCEPLLTWTAR